MAITLLRVPFSFAAIVLLLIGVEGASAQEDCDDGLVRVYWLESVGMAEEPWRDTYVFDTGEASFFVLHYDPTTEKAEWLDGHMSGTNVVIWDLEPLVGGRESLPFRWVENVGDGEKAVTILIVDMQIYWPVCAKAATVETWKELAGPVPE